MNLPVKLDRGKFTRTQLYTKNYKQLSKAGRGRGDPFPKRELTSWLPRAEWSSLKTHMQIKFIISKINGSNKTSRKRGQK